MKLLFTRSQKDKARRVIFYLNVRGQITPEECDAILRYGFGELVLYVSHDLSKFGDGFKALLRRLFFYLFSLRSFAVHEFGKGKTFKSSDVLELVDIEEQIVDSVQKLKKLIEIASGYEGEQVVDI